MTVTHRTKKTFGNHHYCKTFALWTFSTSGPKQYFNSSEIAGGATVATVYQFLHSLLQTPYVISSRGHCFSTHVVFFTSPLTVIEFIFMTWPPPPGCVRTKSMAPCAVTKDLKQNAFMPCGSWVISEGLLVKHGVSDEPPYALQSRVHLDCPGDLGKETRGEQEYGHCLGFPHTSSPVGVS